MTVDALVPASLSLAVDPRAAFCALVSLGDDVVWLDSADGDWDRGRRSIVALELEPAVVERDGRMQFTGPDGRGTESGLSWASLDERLREEAVGGLGWTGYVAYEAAALFDAALESVQRPLPYPSLRFDRVRAAVIVDGAGTRLEVTGTSAADARRRLKRWQGRLEAPLEVPSAAPLQPLGEPDGEHHRAVVAGLRQRIGEGRIYQACYTFPLWFRRPASLAPHYLALRDSSPGDYGAYVRLGALEASSSSPERLFRVVGRRVECRPMKGTRPRASAPSEDARTKEELATSLKDRAENVMIVDLVRNDIGRVCELGSVQVPELFEIESYATVHQMTSTVIGTLAPDVGPFQLLSAVFPPGSMTGAPKVAACRLLRQIEQSPRGVYSGSIGWMGYDGTHDFSVVIRTLHGWHDRARWDVGGGVVWDSTPEGEWLEALQKAAALRAAGLAFEEVPPRTPV